MIQIPYIYKIENLINGKKYIGKTYQDVEKRWKQHCADSKKEQCKNRPLYRAINKYGEDNFSVQIIEERFGEGLEDREKYWINYYDTYRIGYNATIGGDGRPFIDKTEVFDLYKQYQNETIVSDIIGIDRCSVHNILVNDFGITPISGQEHMRRRNSYHVTMYDLSDRKLKDFYSAHDAARYLKDEYGYKNIESIRTHIIEVCNGKRKTAYKYKWKYL